MGRAPALARRGRASCGAPVEALHLAGGRIAGATVAGQRIEADHYVAALPVEVMRQLASPALRAAEPRLNGLDRLVTRWMNGVLFYLDRDVPLVNGHAIYIDSEWSLTSISQKQFWPGVDLARRGDGRVRGILSIDVSEWQRPGRRTGKVAQLLHAARRSSRRCGAQLEDHLDGALDGVEVIDRFLDPAIVFPNPTGAANLEPLLVNTAGSWADRPDAVTRIGEPVPGLGLRAHAHRPRDDGGRQRGGAPGGQRDPRRDGLERAALRGVGAARAAGVRRRAGAGPRALEAVPAAGQAAAGALRGGRAAPDRDRRPRAAARAYAAAASALSDAQARRRAALLERVEAERLDRPDGADRVRPVAAGGALGGPREEARR